MSTINIEFSPELDSRKRYGTHAHLMALSRHIASALLMRMWHAKNHFDPLLRTQYTINFPTKYALNITNTYFFSPESRRIYGTNAHPMTLSHPATCA